MKAEIRCAEPQDAEEWFALDLHLPEAEFQKKVRDRQAYVLLQNGSIAGILRYNLFWDSVPFCNLLYLRESFRRKGLGRLLMSHWEREMRDLGYDFVLTSTQADEEAQHFYRKLGYRDCGEFVLDLKGYEQPMELILAKDLRHISENTALDA